MALRSKDKADEFSALARKMFFSKESIAYFLDYASAAQVNCIIDLIEYEQNVREKNKRARLFRRARFPQVKGFSDYDFSQVGFPEGYSEVDLMSLDYIEAAEDFVFFGQTGRGKTHLAIAIGVACVERGLSCRFFTSAELVIALLRAKGSHALDAFMKDLAKCDLLILDEFGYVPIDIEGARLLFQVISDCYERRSLIITTNIEFSKWGTILGDDKMASAIIDRLVHHGRLVEFNGSSRRMDRALMLGKAEK